MCFMGANDFDKSSSLASFLPGDSLASTLEARQGVQTEASTLLPPVCRRPERSERREGLVRSPLGSVVHAVHQLSVVHESSLSSCFALE